MRKKYIFFCLGIINNQLMLITRNKMDSGQWTVDNPRALLQNAACEDSRLLTLVNANPLEYLESICGR